MDFKRLEDLGRGNFRVQDEKGDVFNYNENSNNRGEVQYNIFDQGETPVNEGNMPSMTQEGSMLNAASQYANTAANIESGTQDALTSFYENNPFTVGAMEGGSMVSDVIPTNTVTNSGVIPFLESVSQDERVKTNPVINKLASGFLENAKRIRNSYESAMFNLGAETDEEGNTFLNSDISPISNRNIGKNLIEVSNVVHNKFGDLLQDAMRSISIARDAVKSTSENTINPDIDFERILNMTMGGAATRGIGGTLKNLPSSNIIGKILNKNKKSIENINKAKNTGDMSMSSRDRAFLREEKSKYLK